MSDLPGHDHDPDPAALDELQRAFSDGDRAEDQTGDGAEDQAGEQPGAAADQVGDGARRVATPTPDVAASIVTVDDLGGDPQGAGDFDDRVDDGSGPVDLVIVEQDHDGSSSRDVRSDRDPSEGRDERSEHGAAADRGQRSDGGPSAGRDVRSDGGPSADRDERSDGGPSAGRDVRSEHGAAAERGQRSDGGPSADRDVRSDRGPAAERDQPSERDRPEEGVVDEPSPRVIRIDDYHGSTEISHDDATPEPLRDTPSRTVDEPEGGAEDVADAGAVISIGDDELPDAVYVEGSLDADGSGRIVFIEDDDTSDVLGPESERELRRGIEPRMRERRVAVRRAQGRRRLMWLAVVAGVVAVIVAGLAVLGSSLFAVREGGVEVYGARYADGQRLDEIIDDAVGTPVLRLDTERIESDIEAIPWVDQASVSIDFPHGLVIDIREREAWTTYRGPDGRFRVLDREGRVLDVLDLYPYAYVLIGGPDPVDLEAGEFAPQGYVAASELAKNLTGSMRGRVTGIEVTADGSRLVVNLDDGSTVMFGEARDLLAKLVRLESVLTNGQEREPGLIDVSTADVTR